MDRLPVGGVLIGPDHYMVGSLSLASGHVAALHEGGRASDGHSRIAVAGLRNAHVHLDLSHTRGVARATSGFRAWVLDLIDKRGSFSPETLQRAAADGARESLAAGTTSVGDIDSSGGAASAVAASGLAGISFREVLGSADPSRVIGDVSKWVENFASMAPSSRLRPGISPHAPYSTSPELYRAVAKLALERELPTSPHLAETHAESEFVHHGTGEFAQLLATLGVRSPLSSPPGCGPLEYAKSLEALTPDSLIAHANYPEEGDVERLLSSGATVVYCPRSHNFFGHSRHPVRRYLSAGVPVCLGTDSRASNASLSMFDELAFLRAARPDLTPSDLWRMATVNGARFLDRASGELYPGESADLLVVELPGGLPANLDQALEGVTSGGARVVATAVSGMAYHLNGVLLGGALPLTQAISELCSHVFL